MKKQEEVKKEEKPAALRAKVGDIVMYTRSVSTQTGSTTESNPAMVVGYPKDSNFQVKDQAVDLIIFGSRGAPVDQKYGVMHSATPIPGRWSHRE